MKTKTFNAVLFTVLTLCVLITVSLIVYTAIQYYCVSIITFIAKELWW